MKRSTLASLSLTFTLVSCGGVSSGIHGSLPAASQSPVTETRPATPAPAPANPDPDRTVPPPPAPPKPVTPAPPKPPVPTAPEDGTLTGTWTWLIKTTSYRYDFEGRVEWTKRSTTGKVTTVTGRRFECFGAQPCKENGTVTLTSDGQSIRIEMIATTQNCPPQPDEPCTPATGRWFEGEDADGKIEQAAGQHVILGKANVYSRKPEIDVHFEMRSMR